LGQHVDEVLPFSGAPLVLLELVAEAVSELGVTYIVVELLQHGGAFALGDGVETVFSLLSGFALAGYGVAGA